MSARTEDRAQELEGVEGVAGSGGSGSIRLTSGVRPAGDQQHACDTLAAAIRRGERDVCLLGATGTGKTYTCAMLLAELDRPALVIAPNKTLAAQLAGELRELLAENAVEYFVSYYDFYQPEAYLAASDTFIDKEATINDEIDRLRHRTTASLLSRRDVIVVASVSCIYGLGDVEQYRKHLLVGKVGDETGPQQLVEKLVQMGYTRNDATLGRGQFRRRGDVVEVHSSGDEIVWRIEHEYDRICRISRRDPLLGTQQTGYDTFAVYAATHYISDSSRTAAAVLSIREELSERTAELEREGRSIEAQRLRIRCEHDLELLETTGTCPGVENYSRHFDQRSPGQPPTTLIDFLPEDFICIVDESHLTYGQIGAMHAGDASRKASLIEHGFRLPSAADNRPLTFEEFRGRTGQTLWVSATPSERELALCRTVAEQLIRPTGVLDPEIHIRPSLDQIDDLIAEIAAAKRHGGRTLVTCLTKRMAEDLVEHLSGAGVKADYLHSDIDTVERIEVLRRLREGTVDVLVGINLLREGLDMPEVSLVAVLDADKEGFLRSRSALIQTFGRAARNPEGRVVCYADQMTDALRQAVAESERRRQRQQQHNDEHGVVPVAVAGRALPQLGEGGGRHRRTATRGRNGATTAPDRPGPTREGETQPAAGPESLDVEQMSVEELLEAMQAASDRLDFETAALLRDLASERTSERASDAQR